MMRLQHGGIDPASDSLLCDAYGYRTEPVAFDPAEPVSRQYRAAAYYMMKNLGLVASFYPGFRP